MKLRANKRTMIAGVAVVAAALASVAGFQVAQADDTQQERVYLQVGGSGLALPEPECTGTYDAANESLNGGTPVPICYPASIPPAIGVGGETPAPPGTPSYDDSVQQGVDNLIQAIHDTHADNPGAGITIVGYSQGADVANRVLEMIAGGEVDVPREVFEGKLYSDPRQPETGIWAKVPAGTSIEGITSPGPGPEDFGGIPVEQHCIAKDGICDATSLEGILGYFIDHDKYPAGGNIIQSTIGEPAANEVIWHDPQGL